MNNIFSILNNHCKIKKDYIEQLYNSIVYGSKNIESIKLEIIKEKNKALFFNKDVVSSFEKLTSDSP